MSHAELDPRIGMAADQIIGGMKMGKTPEQSAADLIHMGIDQRTVEAGLERVLERARNARALRIPESLVDPKSLTRPWYAGVTAGDRNWPALRDALRADGLPSVAVDSIDQASGKIVGLLAPPWTSPIRTRGLVLGYVQSGKTSNFTAVIAKAADQGYKLFVVLSGIHNNLRRQTQERLDEQLVQAGSAKWGQSTWIPLTSLHADFGRQIPDPDALLTVADRSFLCVVKKNTRRLENLVTWLESASSATLNACPVLVIDDEADQASPNSAREEDERTRINQFLVRLLGLPKAAYIGYTATPFANLFVDPKFPADIYPRDFIVDLPRPAEYFGPERLFGRNTIEVDEELPDDGLDMIRRISDEEVRALQPPRSRKDNIAFRPTVPESLRDAIRYFLLASAARRARGQVSHSTMLVHTTSLTSVHLAYQEPIAQVVSDLRKAVAGDDAHTIVSLRNLWKNETERVLAASLGETPVTFSELEPHLAGVLDGVAVIVDN